jgi:cupin 2 domain-containing protein
VEKRLVQRLETVKINRFMPNLLASIPANLPDELVETLVKATSIRIERIVSDGQCSPDDFWYDQTENEFVLLVQGAARLRFENEAIELRPCDWINIPAHRKHRVEWTSPDEKTIWLAVSYN